MIPTQNLFGEIEHPAEPKIKPVGVCGCWVDVTLNSDDKQGSVKRYLMAGGRLTVLDCIKKFRTTELKRIINRLRKHDKGFQGDYVIKDGRRMYKQYFYVQSPQV